MATNLPTLESIQFHDPLLPSSGSIYSALKSLKQDSLSLRNRLRSITTDSAYVVELQESLLATAQPITRGSSLNPDAPRCTWPLIANERNGSWYIPPERKAGSAYFKSTDGHQGQWAFSLRRLNLGVLDLLGECGGAILVDSTRTGKLFPDALSKTVPIWTTVMNSALFPGSTTPITSVLQTPPSLFSSSGPNATYLAPTEISSISSLLPRFIASLQNLSLPLASLRERLGAKPIKLAWAVHGSSRLTMPALSPADLQSFNILVLCSASQRVQGAEVAQAGYVQGAADDAEGWSGGLSAEGFWEVIGRSGLNDIGEVDLAGLVEDVLKEGARKGGWKSKENCGVEVAEGLFVGSTDSALTVWEKKEKEFTRNIIVLVCNRTVSGEKSSIGQCDICAERTDKECMNADNETSQLPKQLCLDLPTGKLGSRALRKELPRIKSFIYAHLKEDIRQRILVTCETGKDLAVGVALMVLCLFYKDNGSRVIPAIDDPKIDKGLVRKRLVWIVEKMNESRTSRATLNAVNEFLIGR